MAIITPQTDVYFLKMPLEVNDTNQLTFSNLTAQLNYFDGLTKLHIGDDFTYQRKDGIMRVPALIDDLYGYNYCMYKNKGHGNKWFFAFITGMEYLNDSVTGVSLKTDVWQTWQFDLTYKKTFVEREHVNDDTVGANTVPENLETGEYQICDLKNIPMYETSTPSTDWRICFCVTKYPSQRSDGLSGDDDIASENSTVGGVFNGLHFFAVATMTAARNLIKVYNEDSGVTADAIKNVFMIPDCLVNNPTSGITYTTVSSSSVSGGVTLYPLFDSATLGSYDIQQPAKLAGNYTPVNNKLKTYPFSYFYMSNKAGEDIVYHWEDFPFKTISGTSAKTVTYKKAYTPTASISAKLYFTNYKSHAETADYGTRLYNYGINFSKVPVCAWTTDYYTNWLTQNGVNMATDVVGGLMGAGLGIGMGVAFANPLGVVGAGINAFNSISNTIGQIHKAAVTPPQAHGDLSMADVMYAYTRNSISFYAMTVKPEIARICDDYFSMYGYKVNRVKAPNITGRRNWNFVKTIGCYIEADIPQDDLEEIKSMFDKGITLWHNPSTFMDYSQTNDII